jgi:hypothetical protein
MRNNILEYHFFTFSEITNVHFTRHAAEVFFEYFLLGKQLEYYDKRTAIEKSIRIDRIYHSPHPMPKSSAKNNGNKQQKTLPGR